MKTNLLTARNLSRTGLRLIQSAFILSLVISISGVFAQTDKKTETKTETTTTKKSNLENPEHRRNTGVMVDFRRLEEAIRKNRRKSRGLRTRILEGNLVRAMKTALFRRYYWKIKGKKDQSIIKDLNPKAIKYDNPTSPLIYYVLYKKKYFLRLEFSRDPEYYIQSATFEKFLNQDWAKDKGATDHKPASTPAAGGGEKKTTP